MTQDEKALLMMWSKFSIGLVAALIAVCAPSQAKGPTNSQRNDAHIFEKFKALAGTFVEVEVEGRPAIIEYRLISRGTALTETWIMPAGQYGANGKRELTVFHMDNGVLVATHYCAAGIHPSMILDPESPSGEYNFTARNIANLSSSDQSHNSGFGYTFESDDTVYRSEEWTVSGKKQLSHMRMTRKSD